MSQCIISASISLSSHRNLAGVTAGKWLWLPLASTVPLVQATRVTVQSPLGRSSEMPLSKVSACNGIWFEGERHGSWEAGAGSFGRRDVYLSVKHGQGWGEWEGSRKAEGGGSCPHHLSSGASGKTIHSHACPWDSVLRAPPPLLIQLHHQGPCRR